jgi:hypothetical protein
MEAVGAAGADVAARLHHRRDPAPRVVALDLRVVVAAVAVDGGDDGLQASSRRRCASNMVAGSPGSSLARW